MAVTTDSVGELGQIHDRTPLILAEPDWDALLNPDAPLKSELLAQPPDVRGVELRRVSTLVNSIRNNGPELLEPAEPQPEHRLQVLGPAHLRCPNWPKRPTLPLSPLALPVDPDNDPAGVT